MLITKVFFLKRHLFSNKKLTNMGFFDFIKGIFGGAKNKVEDVAEGAADVAENVVDKAGDVLGDVAEGAKNVGGKVWDKATDLAEDAGEVLGDVAEGARDMAGKAWDKAGDLAEDASEIAGNVVDKAGDVDGDVDVLVVHTDPARVVEPARRVVGQRRQERPAEEPRGGVGRRLATPAGYRAPKRRARPSLRRNRERAGECGQA